MVELAAVVLITSGIATRYGEGVMESVIANRVDWGEIVVGQGEVGYVALLDPDDIGRMVWLERPEGWRSGKNAAGGYMHRVRRMVIGPVLVVDCAAKQDRERLRQSGWAVDLSYELAVQFYALSDVVPDMRVWDGPPPVREPWQVEF
jgi:hypothetical protein